jgi:uncharacterized small protein (DUF1192 family)
MDEDEQRPRFAEWPSRSIDTLSVESLEAYRRQLEAELARVARTLDARGKQKAAAEALFKR